MQSGSNRLGERCDHLVNLPNLGCAPLLSLSNFHTIFEPVDAYKSYFLI